jgi:hypothetical protein
MVFREGRARKTGPRHYLGIPNILIVMLDTIKD